MTILPTWLQSTREECHTEDSTMPGAAARKCRDFTREIGAPPLLDGGSLIDAGAYKVYMSDHLNRQLSVTYTPSKLQVVYYPHG